MNAHQFTHLLTILEANGYDVGLRCGSLTTVNGIWRNGSWLTREAAKYQNQEPVPTCQPASGSNSGHYQLNTGDIGRSFWCRVTRNGKLLTSASGASVERAVAEAVRKVRLARHCGSL